MPVTLPPEESYTETELLWIEHEPPGVFPGDQTSLWGQARKVFADYYQREIADKLSSIYASLDPLTADEIGMARWETMLGIPIDTTKTLEQRRAFVEARRQRGPFTHAKRNAIIESFISATFGVAPTFGIGGIPLGAGGVPLASGEDSLAGTYAVIENIAGMTYVVYIKATVTVDEAGLTRELERITTAPIQFTLYEGLYVPTIMADTPRAFWRLGTPYTADASGNGHTLTPSGTVTQNQPGLLVGDLDDAAVFATNSNQMHTGTDIFAAPAGAYTLECWAKPASLPASGQFMTPLSVTSSGGVSQYIRFTGTAGNVWSGVGKGSGGATNATSAVAAAVGTKAYLALAYDGARLKFYVNGTLAADVAMVGNAANGPAYIGDLAGSSNEFAGTIDEVAIYDYALSAAQIAKHYQTGLGN